MIVKTKTAAVIVAHPDDETLWAGGTMLSHPDWEWFTATLCRASDPDRAPKFYRALNILGSKGDMAGMDDGPEQLPLNAAQVQETIIGLLPKKHFDLLITHHPKGEYTRHLRHEEVSSAVIQLWSDGRLRAYELWVFAYEDGQRQYPPKPVESADLYQVLPEDIWQKKYEIITKTYGFGTDGFEAKATTRSEAFWRFTDPKLAKQWLNTFKV